MIPTQRLHEILDRFSFVEAKMNEVSDPAEIASLGREYAGLRDVVETIRAWQAANDDLEAAEEMASDPELAELAADEMAEIRERLPALSTTNASVWRELQIQPHRREADESRADDDAQRRLARHLHRVARQIGEGVESKYCVGIVECIGSDTTTLKPCLGGHTHAAQVLGRQPHVLHR